MGDNPSDPLMAHANCLMQIITSYFTIHGGFLQMRPLLSDILYIGLILSGPNISAVYDICYAEIPGKLYIPMKDHGQMYGTC